ncbi:MAG: hypothetical protein Kow00114_31910 [Kiloniellaceae bacterium]
MSRLPYFLAAAALALPLPAYADCGARIAAVESHPAIMERPQDESAAPARPSAGNEEAVKDQMVQNGEAVEENGGETVYPEGGPATPRENWFTTDQHEAAALTHLDAARDAHQAGDERGCLESIEQAESILKPDAG